MAPRRHGTRVVSADPGIDDALALIFLELASPSPPNYVVATGGNVPAEAATRNCAFLAREFHLSARGFAGSDPPLEGTVRDATDIHGLHGLAHLRAPARILPPAGQLHRELLNSGADVDLLVLGPATDAAAMLGDQAIRPLVKRILLMGGAFEPRDNRLGNVTPYSEFNAYMDPRALERVLAGPAPCRMVPLDATERRLFTEEELLHGLGRGHPARLVVRLVRFLCEVHARMGHGHGVYMHDVLAAAAWAGLIEARWRRTQVQSVPSCGWKRGKIVHSQGQGWAVEYATEVDTDAFLELWQESMARLA